MTLPYWALRVLIADVMPARGVRVQRLKTESGRVYRVYMPEKRLYKTAVCFLHGGGWRVGWPAIFAFFGKRLAQAGFCAVLPSYVRLRGGYAYMEEDVGHALDAAARHFFADVKPRWALTGVSAGGQMAVSMALGRNDVVCAAAVSAPMRFDGGGHPVLRALLRNLFRDETLMEAHEPRRLLRRASSAPRILLIHGQRDPWVACADSELEHGTVTRICARARHTNCIARALLRDTPENAALLAFLRQAGGGSDQTRQPHSYAKTLGNRR